MAISKVRVKINGVWNNLAKNSSTGKWEGTITAPANTSYTQSGGYYAVTVEATNTAGTVTTKDATDTTIGQALRLIVKETVKPVIKLVQPSNGAYISNNKIPIIFDVTDESGGSGVKTSAVSLKVGTATYTESSAGMVKTSITNGYRFIYTPQSALADGAKAIVINAKDNDGNAATQISASFTVDTVPPTLTISNPQNGLNTNKSSLIVSGTTNDTLSSPVTVKVKHKETIYTPGIDNSGNFSQALVLTEGENTITVTSTDAAGKYTSITLNVLLDTSVPAVKTVTFTPNPVNASSGVLISLEVE